MWLKENKSLLLALGIFILAGVVFLGTASSQQTYSEIFTGRIEATEVDVNSKAAGKVAEIKVEEGENVSKGQVLAILESNELKAKEKQTLALVEAATEQVKQAEEAYNLSKEQSAAVVMRGKAVVEAAGAQARKAQNGARMQEIKAAEAVTQKAYAGYLLADKTYQRVLLLQKEGAIPQQEVDRAETALEVAKDDYKAALEQLTLAKEGARTEDIDTAQAKVREAEAALSEAYAGEKQVEIRFATLQAAKAQLKQAQAALDEVRAYLDNTIIKAPIAGTVTMRTADAGEIISSGMPILTITKFEETWVEVKLPETKVVNLKLADKVLVKVAGAKQGTEGKIVRISALPDFATKRATSEAGGKDIVSFGVKVVISNNNMTVKPGMTAEVSFK